MQVVSVDPDPYGLESITEGDYDSQGIGDMNNTKLDVDLIELTIKVALLMITISVRLV